MKAPAWLRRPGRPSSPPESSRSAGGGGSSRRPASSSGSFGSSAALRLRRGLRPALAAALLALPLLAGLPTGAAAQTAVECTTANTDGSYPVPNDWALKPSGLAAGAQFRLLFVTSTQRDGSATDIATYNTYVQTRAKAGHSAITDSCGNRFTVVGSTSAVDARDNTGTTGTGVPIYWLTGSKLADNYADFYDGTWDSYSVKLESGGGLSGNVSVFTGSNTDGTKHNAHFGHSAAIRNGVVQSGADPISAGTTPPSFTRHLFGLSPVFTVAAPPDATVSIVSGGSPLPGGYADEQGTNVVIEAVTLSAIQTSHVPFRACFSSSFTSPSFSVRSGVVPITLTNGCLDSDISSGFSAFSFTVWGTPDSTDEPDEVVTITVTDDPNTARPAGVAPINVSDTVTIRDDDPTVASLARVGSGAVTEGGQVEFTVTLGRALVVGETIDVPLSISGTGVTTGDWSLAAKSGAANTGVGLRDVGTAAPKVRFSGAGARTATLELTPANEGTTEGAETFTIALGSNTAFDAAALGTDVGGGADPHGTANAFTVVVNDGVAASLAARPSTVREGGVSFVTVTGFPSSWGAPRIRSLAGATTSLRCDHVTDGLSNSGNNLDVCVGLADGTRTRGHWDGVAYRLTLTVVADGVAENESLTVTFEDSTDTSRTRTAVIALDDRSPLPFVSLEAVVGTNPGNVVSPTPHTVTEGGAFNLRVKMDPWFRLATPVIVNYYLADYHGERVVRGPSLTDPKRDRDPNPRSIEIGAGHSATVIHIPTVASPDLDGDSKVEVILLGGRDYATSTGKLTLTVQDADPVTNIDDNTRAQMLATPSTLTLGADAASVTEGGEVTFTVTAAPAPGYDLPVHLGASEEMGAGLDYIGLERARTVTIPAGATSAAWTVTTWSDDKQRADGTVVARIKPGDGYTAGTPSTVTVALLDDDAPALDPSLVAQVRILAGQTHNGAAHVLRWRRVLVAFGVEAYPGVTAMTAAQAEANARRYSSPLWPRIAEAIGAIGAAGSDPAPQQAATQQAAPAVDPALVALVRSYAAETHNGAAHVERWMRVLAAFGEDNGRAPMTAAEARTYADRGWTRWDPVVVAIAALEAAPEPEPQPVIPPAVSVAAGEAVSEGGGAVFTLTAAPAPASPLAVEVTVGAEGDFGIAAGARTVTVPTSGSLVLTLATVDDGTDEPDGSVSVTLNGGDGYTVGSPASGAVAVTDDDLPPPVVSVTAKAGSITEGAGAVFTVTADRAPDAALAVRLTVSEEAGSDFVAAGDEGGRTVTIPAGTTGVALTVATDDDAADEPDGSVSAAVDAGAGYTVAASPGDTASVAVADNDAAATGASLSVDDATVKEGAGLMWFTLRLSAPSERAVRVSYRTRESSPVSARQGRDYLAAGWHLYFQPGETEKRVWVWVYDDSHDEDPETFEFVLTEATVVPIADGVAVGTIVNDDPLPAAFLARFGRTVAEQALDGIAGRMAAPRTPGMQGTVAGQALNFDPAAGRPAAGATPGATPADRDTALAMADIARGFGADAPAAVSPGGAGDRFGDARAGASLAQSRSMTARDALLGSSFSLTGAADGSGGSLAFWGRASQGSFDGREGTFSLDGTVTTGMLGADYARGKWLVGLALAQSAGEGDYRDTGVSPRPDGQTCPDGVDAELCGGAVRAGDGKVEASLTAAIPYAALQASERLKLWGAAGYGTGEVTLKTALGDSYSSDTAWSMAAAGLRGDLLAPPAEGGGPALALTSDALWTRTSSEKTRDLAASDSDATRLRLGLEGSWRFAMEGGGSLVPKLEIGARHDGGDAETGFGVELGGGIAWSDPALGLSLDVSGRTLLAHENDDLKDRGYAASLAFDPAPGTQRGPSLSLRQEFGGQASGGLDALFQPATLEDRTGGVAASRWAAEAAYGFPAFGGRWTGSPHVGLGLATGARDYSVGWRLTPEANAPDFSFGLRATRRESDAQAPEHTVGVEITARW